MSTSSQIAGYLRVAAYAIAAFDYLQTLPAEYRLYAKQQGPSKLSVACIASSLFCKEACAKFYWMAPVFKLFLYLASQAILALRTYAVSRRSSIVLRILIVLFIVCALGEFISTFWKPIPVQNNFKYFIALSLRESDLEPAAPGGISQVSKWPPYITSVTWFSMWFRWASLLSRLARMMLEDGIMDFVALTAMNIDILQKQRHYSSVLRLLPRFRRDDDIQLALHPKSVGSNALWTAFQATTRTRRPRERAGGGAGAGQTMAGTGSEGPELVVTVVKKVVTMHDMGTDDESARQVKGGKSSAALALFLKPSAFYLGRRLRFLAKGPRALTSHAAGSHPPTPHRRALRRPRLSPIPRTSRPHTLSTSAPRRPRVLDSPTQRALAPTAPALPPPPYRAPPQRRVLVAESAFDCEPIARAHSDAIPHSSRIPRLLPHTHLHRHRIPRPPHTPPAAHFRRRARTRRRTHRPGVLVECALYCEPTAHAYIDAGLDSPASPS
ncbi:hypothetical protein B0H13DRAFT_2360182 [Mycena leptocephala]|nr:hypothetical protein B0H13DRAFT_2360182 [Mycena leptocephala]